MNTTYKSRDGFWKQQQFIGNSVSEASMPNQHGPIMNETHFHICVN